MANRDQCVIITGGGSGIGRAAAILCADGGYRVGVLDKNREAAVQTASHANKHMLAIECDVSIEQQVSDAFATCADTYGLAWGVFANAGIDKGGLIHELPLETWNEVISTNLTGVFLTAKYAALQMMASGRGGSLVCTSSPTASVALAAGAVGAYSASKAGILALVRCMAIDYARWDVRVNALVPGATESQLMWSNVQPSQVPALRTQLNREIPAGRLAQAQEPAKAVLWLFSEDSSYVTGSSLVCDGGVLAKSSISV